MGGANLLGEAAIYPVDLTDTFPTQGSRAERHGETFNAGPKFFVDFNAC
jgi:hypothetical protein